MTRERGRVCVCVGGSRYATYIGSALLARATYVRAIARVRLQRSSSRMRGARPSVKTSSRAAKVVLPAPPRARKRRRGGCGWLQAGRAGTRALLCAPRSDCPTRTARGAALERRAPRSETHEKRCRAAASFDRCRSQAAIGGGTVRRGSGRLSRVTQRRSLRRWLPLRWTKRQNCRPHSA